MSITEAAASVAARAFFYPSLAYNIARSRLQDTWNWWDEITENVILGALPFHSTLEDLKQMRVSAVVTLNEEFEVFITPEQYKEAGFRHLHIPTVDFLYAPQTADLHRGADFIHEVVAEGGRTYVHCKAGRGRSTTLVLCYLVKYLQQTPADAYAFVRERRPQVYLAHGQWTAVCAFYMSCHPEKELTIEDFPYPTFLPIAPGKQGSDGPEPESMDGAAVDELTVAAVTTAAAASDGGGKVNSQSGQREAQAGEAPAENGGDLPAAQPREPPSDAASTGDRDGGSGGTAVGGSGAGGTAVGNGPAFCGDDAVGSSPNLVRISAHAAETDDVVLLHHLGSDHSGSDLSLSSSMASCRLNPRTVRNLEAEDPDGADGPGFASSQPGFRPPERVSSPAIEIRRGRSTEHKPLGNGTAPWRSNGTTSSGGLSKASIALEPSGSLPGYVRIAHVGQTPSSSDDSSGPAVQTSFASTGFTPIEDWADVDKRFAGR